MVKVPSDRDLARTTWVTNSRVSPNRVIMCRDCKGVIYFNIDELTERKRRGRSTSTSCRHCNYHPSFPPEPYLEFDGKLEKENNLMIWRSIRGMKLC